MEERNELSDIVLEKSDGSKNMKLKRILIIAAILVLLFLAVLIIMRALNKPSQTQEARLVLPPEPQSAPTTQTNEERLFQQVPIIEEEEKESFDDVVKKLKEKELERTSQTTVETKTAQSVKEPEVAKEPKAVAKIEPKPKEPTSVKSSSPSQPKSNVATPGTYIQVLSVSRVNPDPKYLSTLVEKGYKYSLYRTTVNNKNVTKILVGPYKNYTEAKNALANVRRDIASGAFIFKVQ
jgi:DedD protein